MVASLRVLAENACAKNIEGIVDIGDLSWELLANILRRVVNPDQLRLIETNSPHLAGVNDGELWRAMIARDVRNGENRIIFPQNPANWHKVYRKLKREDAAQDSIAEAHLAAALSAHKETKERDKTVVLNTVIDPVGHRRAARAGHSNLRQPAYAGSGYVSRAPTQSKAAPGLLGKALGVNKPPPSRARTSTLINSRAIPSTQNHRTVPVAPQSLVRQYQTQSSSPPKPTPTRTMAAISAPRHIQRPASRRPASAITQAVDAAARAQSLQRVNQSRMRDANVKTPTGAARNAERVAGATANGNANGNADRIAHEQKDANTAANTSTAANGPTTKVMTDTSPGQRQVKASSPPARIGGKRRQETSCFMKKPKR